VDLGIAAGEFFFLLGPSGCGKTTLLRMLAGLVVPTAGSILFDGEDVTDRPVHRRNTAMVFQNYALWPHMTVQANVEFGPKMRKVSADERRRCARRCLETVKMEHLFARRPRELSGGQQQRVALARALAAQPGCLLLDEPLSNLDARLRLEMRQHLREIVKKSGTTAVYVTHDQKEALAMADRMAVMDEGRIAQVGRPEELYERPANRFVADFVGEANFIDGTLAPSGASGTVRLDTRAGVLLAARTQPAEAGGPVTACIRPERLELATDESEPALAAEVAGKTYQGETVQYRLVLASGETWKMLAVGGPPALERGRKVRLKASPEAVVLLPAANAPQSPGNVGGGGD
jgi:iron(III) transport system ATP-binding protein